MDPLGSIRERKVEEETQEDVSCQGFEIDPQQLLTDERSKNNKSTLIKKFFRQDEDKSLRRTSSFMLRSQVEGGGKYVSSRFHPKFSLIHILKISDYNYFYNFLYQFI